MSTMKRERAMGQLKKYRVFVNGTNLLLRIDGVLGRYGFYTTRYVEAPNGTSAAEKALTLIREELQDMVLNELTDKPSLDVEETQHLVSFGDAIVPGQGFSLYEEKPH